VTQIENKAQGGAALPYVRSSEDNAGAHRLAHAMDVEHISAFATGERVLDVNVGVGRLALPLLRQGKQVTGIDASSAVLEECRRNAAGAPITLLVGDMHRVPLPDSSFDTVIAHRTLVAGTDWQAALAHWGQKLVDGGRLLVDVDSLDHRHAALAPGLADKAFADGDEARLCLAVDDIVAFADRAGFTVRAVVPTRSFLCGDNLNLLLAPRLDGIKRWQRLLSWLAVDDSLFELACHLERSLFAKLTSRLSRSMLLVLEKASNPAANREWLARNAALNRLLAEQSVSIASLAPFLGDAAATFPARIEPLLVSLRNRAFLYRLVQPLILHERFDLAGLLPPAVLAEMRDWAERDAMDERVNRLSETWANGVDANLRDLAPALNYPLVRALIADQLKSKPGVKA